MEDCQYTMHWMLGQAVEPNLIMRLLVIFRSAIHIRRGKIKVFLKLRYIKKLWSWVIIWSLKWKSSASIYFSWRHGKVQLQKVFCWYIYIYKTLLTLWFRGVNKVLTSRFWCWCNHIAVHLLQLMVVTVQEVPCLVKLSPFHL